MPLGWHGTKCDASAKSMVLLRRCGLLEGLAASDDAGPASTGRLFAEAVEVVTSAASDALDVFSSSEAMVEKKVRVWYEELIMPSRTVVS